MNIDDIPKYVVTRNARAIAHNEFISGYGWELTGSYSNSTTKTDYRCMRCGATRSCKPEAMTESIRQKKRCAGCLKAARENTKQRRESIEQVTKPRKHVQRRYEYKTPENKTTVYVLRDTESRYLKIGISINFPERLKTHRAAMPFALEVVRTLHTSRESACRAERDIKVMLREWRSGPSPEWFTYSEWALSVIEGVMNENHTDTPTV